MLQAVLVTAAIGCSEPGISGPPEAVLHWRSAEARGESIPVVDGAAVYNLEQETHILSAIRKTDGVLLWKRTLPVTRPNFDGYGLGMSGSVLVVGDRDLFGIDPATGNIVWRYEPSEGRNPGFGRFAIAGGVVYCGSTSGHIFAVDASTGVERWLSRAMPDTTSIFSPTIASGVVYAGFTQLAGGQPARGGAVAIDANNGAVIWSTFAPVPASDISTENTDGVVPVGGRVFFGSATGVHVADRATGVLSTTLGPEFLGDMPLTPRRPFLVGGMLLVASGSGTVTAVDPTTLARKWQLSATSSVASISGDGNVAYIPSSGRLIAVSVLSGEIEWQFESRSVSDPYEDFLAAPTFDDARVYLPGSKAVYAFRK